MKRVGLDTSVVVRLLTGEPDQLAAAVGRGIEAAHAEGTKFLVSDLVVAECYFALQHHYGATKQGALDALRDLFRASPLRPSGAAATLLATPGLATARPGFVDRLIHADYTSRFDETWTCERAGAKLAKVRVVGG